MWQYYLKWCYPHEWVECSETEASSAQYHQVTITGQAVFASSETNETQKKASVILWANDFPSVDHNYYKSNLVFFHWCCSLAFKPELVRIGSYNYILCWNLLLNSEIQKVLKKDRRLLTIMTHSHQARSELFTWHDSIESQSKMRHSRIRASWNNSTIAKKCVWRCVAKAHQRWDSPMIHWCPDVVESEMEDKLIVAVCRHQELR